MKVNIKGGLLENKIMIYFLSLNCFPLQINNNNKSQTKDFHPNLYLNHPGQTCSLEVEKDITGGGRLFSNNVH